MPTYTIRLGDDYVAGRMNAGRLLSFSISGSTELLPAEENEDSESLPPDEPPASPDFTVELEDAAGQVARVLASDYMSIAPPLRVQYLKPRRLNDSEYNSDWEPVLQTVDVPLVAFTGANPDLQLETARVLRFRFDQQPEGIVIMDNIGSRRRIVQEQ